MEPIISPWLIYSLAIVGGLWKVCLFVSTCFVFGIVAFCGLLMDADSVEDAAHCRCWLKRSIVGAIIFALLAFFLPTKETYVAMIVASYVTPDNIQAVQGNIVDFVSQIVNAVNQVGGK